MISKLLLAANPWHHAEIIGLLPTERERNFQLVDVFGPMVDIVKSPTKADEKALWTVRWKDHIVDPFKAREKGITLISVRDGNKTAAAPKCPSCGSTDYSLMPTDFETAKCNDCGKNWDHGIVKGINEPPKLGSMSKKASYYIPEGYKTPTALAPEMKWLWTPDNGPYVFPMYRMYTKNDRGLKIMCLHEKFCSANGLPSHGYSFDRLDRGYVFSDPSKKLIRISVSGASENIDEALEDMVEEIQYAFPDTAEWRFTTTGPDNRVLRPGLEENDVPRGEKLNHTVDWGLYASTRSKELRWITADKVQPGDILAMSGTFMTVKKATLEGGKVALLGEPGQVRRFNPQDEVNIYKG
jgi:hypothetical protein